MSHKRRRQKIKPKGRQGKRLADQLADQVNSSMTLGTYQEKSRAQWGNFKKKYVDEVLPTKRSVRTREEIHYVLERFERMCRPKNIDGITTATIDHFIAIRLQDKGRDGGTVSNATVNKDLRHLRAVLNKAMKWGVLQEVPEFDMLGEFIDEKPLVTEEEFLAIYDACHVATMPGDQPFRPAKWWRSLVVTCFGTGQRIGALMALEWSQVELAEQRWKSLAEQVKSKRYQYTYFNAVIAEHLSRIRQLSDPRVFPWNHHKTTLYKELGRIQTAAGLDPKRRDFKFHAARRSFVTFNWDLLGPDEVQRRTGHRSRSTTERYRVYIEERRKPAVDAFIPDLPDVDHHAG